MVLPALKGEAGTSVMVPVDELIWNMEMLSVLGFSTKRNRPRASTAIRPPSSRSGNGEPVTGESAPVWPDLANAGMLQAVGEVPGTFAYIYCWEEDFAASGTVHQNETTKSPTKLTLTI